MRWIIRPGVALAGLPFWLFLLPVCATAADLDVQILTGRHWARPQPVVHDSNQRFVVEEGSDAFVFSGQTIRGYIPGRYNGSVGNARLRPVDLKSPEGQQARRVATGSARGLDEQQIQLPEGWQGTDIGIESWTPNWSASNDDVAPSAGEDRECYYTGGDASKPRLWRSTAASAAPVVLSQLDGPAATAFIGNERFADWPAALPVDPNKEATYVISTLDDGQTPTQSFTLVPVKEELTLGALIEHGCERQAEFMARRIVAER